MTTISKEEYEELKALDDKWKWIARDENTHFVNIFEEKPYKDTPIWMWRRDSYVGRIESDMSLFQFIKWEDREPYSIDELIEEYEDEREEKEVKKDIEWLKEQLDDIEMNTPSLGSHDSIWMLDRVNELLNQLDEPEVLSQEWLDEKSFPIIHRAREKDVVTVKDLQEILVPKQEEVDQAYKSGYEKGKEHATRDDEPETVASVMADFFGAAARLKEVLAMEVEEMENDDD